MHLIRLMVAIGLLAALGVATAATAQQNQAPAPKPKPRVILLDQNYNRPPPVPHDRSYVGPGPSVTPPMERIPQVQPLAQPPIR